MSVFWDNYVQLCNKKGVSPSRAAKDVGITTASCSGWRNGAIPRQAVLCRIANYFGISVDELTEDKNNPASLVDTGDLVKIYNILTPDRQQRLRSEIAALLKEQLQA